MVDSVDDSMLFIFQVVLVSKVLAYILFRLLNISVTNSLVTNSLVTNSLKLENKINCSGVQEIRVD